MNMIEWLIGLVYKEEGKDSELEHAIKHVGRIRDNYDPQVDRIFETLLTEEIILFENGKHYMEFETINFKVKAWNCNKFFAWLNTGEILNKRNDKIFKWENQMPGPLTLYRFSEKIKDIEDMEVNELLGLSFEVDHEDLKIINYIYANKDNAQYKGMWEKFKTAYRMRT